MSTNAKIRQLKVKGKVYDLDVPKNLSENNPLAVEYVAGRTHFGLDPRQYFITVGAEGANLNGQLTCTEANYTQPLIYGKLLDPGSKREFHFTGKSGDSFTWDIEPENDTAYTVTIIPAFDGGAGYDPGTTPVSLIIQVKLAPGKSDTTSDKQLILEVVTQAEKLSEIFLPSLTCKNPTAANKSVSHGDILAWNERAGKFMPGALSLGEGENTIVIGEAGLATGSNSIAGGTIDLELIKNILGSGYAELINKYGNITNLPDFILDGILSAIDSEYSAEEFRQLLVLSPSEAEGLMSIALGANNSAKSASSITLGFGNTSGGKGYYITEVNPDTSTITLSTTQAATTAPVSIDWSAGDMLMIVNDDRYFAAIKEVLGNKVVLEQMPFTELAKLTSAMGYNLTSPNERSVINIDKPTAGEVVFGYGAISIGTQNIATGNNALAFGNKNKAIGDFGVALGQENLVGYSALASGIKAYALGKSAVATGINTHAIGKASHAEGDYTTASGTTAHAEGVKTVADGAHSHAEGAETEALGVAAHAEGYQTRATGDYSHAEGRKTVSEGEYSHAEGRESKATGICSHAEGEGITYEGVTYINEAAGKASHTEGGGNKASGNYSHAEGFKTEALGNNSHAEGWGTKAKENGAHAEGDETEAYYYAHAEGKKTIASGKYSHAEGTTYESTQTEASGEGAHAEGRGTLASAPGAHAEGCATKATANGAHAEGDGTTASGMYSHAEGFETAAEDFYSHVEGYRTHAKGYASHAEGYMSTIEETGKYAHAEGDNNIVSGQSAHAEGAGNIVSGTNAHGEGASNIASGAHSHAEGYDTEATNTCAHAEGYETEASGEFSHASGRKSRATASCSHASGLGAIASAEAQTVVGKFNEENLGALFIVGNGSSESSRKNAFEVLSDDTGTARVKVGNMMEFGTAHFCSVVGPENVITTGNYTGSWTDPANTSLALSVRGSGNTVAGICNTAVGLEGQVSSEVWNGVVLGKRCQIFKDTDFDFRDPWTGEVSDKINGPIAGGYKSISTRNESVAYGECCVSHGSQSFALGEYTNIDHNCNAAFALGSHLVASNSSQVVVGCANKLSADKLFIVGNGNVNLAAERGRGTDSDSSVYKFHEDNRDFNVIRSNAFTVDLQGNGEFAGSVIISGGKLQLGEISLTEAQLAKILSVIEAMNIISDN